MPHQVDKRRKTPKERVLERYPGASCKPYLGCLWLVVNGRNQRAMCESQFSPQDAWADAARRLSRRKPCPK